MVLRAIHLCSGYGGFELGFRLAGMPPPRTVAHVERDAYAAATLVARMEEAHLDIAPVWSDLDTFDAGPWAGRVDIITAGFPCQPFSAAGSRRGVDDDRWLWPSIRRVICDVGPRFVFLENVPQLVRLGLPHVLADLAELGFDAEWGLCSAAEVGAPHKRDRFWLLGHSGGERRSEVTRGAPGDEGADGWRSDGADVADGAGEDVAHTASIGDAPGQRPGQRTSGRSQGIETRRGTGLAHTTGERLQGPDEREPQLTEPARPAWPPARGDAEGWAEWTAQGGPKPAVRRGLDGRPAGLADALHLGGNGLVPRVAAEAFTVLLHRLYDDKGEVK